MKGKVAKGLTAGLPMVLTRIAAEGMDLADDESVLIADTPEAFAEAVVRLYHDDALRARLAAAARRVGERLYGMETVRRHWAETFAAIDGGRARRAASVEAPPARRSGYRRLPRRETIAPNVTIVLPVHNCLAYTQQCVETIRRYTTTPHEVLIVDNASTDGTAGWCDEAHIRRLPLPENRGFAAACNTGIHAALGEYVIILNNDTVVSPGWAERLLAHLDRDRMIGLVGPSTNYASSVQQIPSRYEGLDEFLAFAKRLAREHAGQGEEVDRLVGVCLAARRQLFDEVGLLDERFGMGNYEDDDLCMRVRQRGYTLVWAKDVFIHHVGSQTFASMQVDYQALLARNREILRRKWDLRAHAPERIRHVVLTTQTSVPAGVSLAPSAEPDQEQLHAAAEAVRARRWDDALAALTPLGAAFPASGRVQGLWGQALWGAGRHVEAEARLRRAISLSPADRGWRFLLAQLYLETGRASDALAELEAWQRIDPSDKDAEGLIVALRRRHAGERHGSEALSGKA